MSTQTSHIVAAMLAALRAARRSEHISTKQEAARRATMRLAAEHNFELAPEVRVCLNGGGSNAQLDSALDSMIEQLQLTQRRAADTDSVILVVEDDRLTARIHADALADIENAVVIASTGQRAEALLREHNVSIILLDLVLPDADGRDLLMRLRASAATRSLPIVVITARMDPSTQAECYALGADALLTKPVDADVLAAVVAGQLDHAYELRVAGRIDRLTGLANRAALTDTLDHLAPLATRTRSPLSLAMIDLDHFKSINDAYGHDVGDMVLERSAQTIVQALRTSDLAARWGGEEFCVVFPDTNTRGAARALNKALDAVRALIFQAKGESFAVTFSAGVATYVPGSAVADTMKEADRLLYLAKKSGRNRVFSVEEEADPPRPRVLLVEDDESVSRVVSTLLKREGFAVDCHQDGESALRAVEAGHFVLAVVDVNLPALNGFELVARMRAMPATAKLPVLMLTGSAEEEDIVRAFETGVSDYVTKPFLPRELAARIHRLVPKR